MFLLGSLAFGMVCGWLAGLIGRASAWPVAVALGAMASLGVLEIGIPQSIYAAAPGAAIGLAAHAAWRAGLRDNAHMANGQTKGDHHA